MSWWPPSRPPPSLEELGDHRDGTTDAVWCSGPSLQQEGGSYCVQSVELSLHAILDANRF